MDIFKNAYFGKPYKARNNDKVFFLHLLDDGSVSCMVGNEKSYGFSILEPTDIVSEWIESKNEATLEEKSIDYADSVVEHKYDETEWLNIFDAYREGYLQCVEDTQKTVSEISDWWLDKLNSATKVDYKEWEKEFNEFMTSK